MHRHIANSEGYRGHWPVERSVGVQTSFNVVLQLTCALRAKRDALLHSQASVGEGTVPSCGQTPSHADLHVGICRAQSQGSDNGCVLCATAM